DRFFLKKVRWQISILAHIGFAIAFGIRANFGVAKNRMMNNFTDAYGDTHEPEFSWTATELGMMESSFFYGYAVSQIPAGIIAAKFAPNNQMVGSVGSGATNTCVDRIGVAGSNLVQTSRISYCSGRLLEIP
ncbi:hypothetical protein TELCIR_17011, partial [Teladorsagia circumcincta]